MRNSVLETDGRTDGRTDRAQVHVLSCASQLKITEIQESLKTALRKTRNLTLTLGTRKKSSMEFRMTF